MSYHPDFNEIKAYFDDKINRFGNTPRGADWNSTTAQELRFSQLARVIDPSQRFSMIDYGCGYGALADFLKRQGYDFSYTGYDILEAMVDSAREAHRDDPEMSFTAREADLPQVDYVVASGIFNIRLDASYEDWTDYVLETMSKMNQLCQKGFSSNFLTRYSDAEYMKSHLYYADPCALFDFCKRNFSRNVAILHDYDLYDFTLIVRKAL